MRVERNPEQKEGKAQSADGGSVEAGADPEAIHIVWCPLPFFTAALQLNTPLSRLSTRVGA